MNEHEIKLILEALLMNAHEPLSLKQMQSAFSDCEKPSTSSLKKVLSDLKKDYNARAIELIECASGYRFQTREEYSHWIVKLHEEKPPKYSSAFLETLAIIAYRQPVTRADIEEIRGVGVSSSIMKTMMEREWIKTAGTRDVPGKPTLYVTTAAFLDYFNLKSLDELPELPVSAEDA